jgi:tetratricopeptide (TPR) repeat protein
METIDPFFNEILANGPSAGTLFLILSRMKENGQIKEVIQECLKALSVHPNDIHIRTLLAESYFEEGQISQAESELEKVAARIDNLISAYILQAEIFISQKRTKEAVKALELYLAHRPDDDSALYLLKELRTAEGIYTPDERKDMPEHDQVLEDSVEERARKRKMKMIAVLESWLGAVREQSRAELNKGASLGPWPVDR